MKKSTRRLAGQVQQALLDLPDALLLETLDGWLRQLDALCEDAGVADGSYGLLGYRPRSEATGRTYASLVALDESEPEAEEFCWMSPTGLELRARLRVMQPTRVYHTVVALAGEVFLHKPFVINWGDPPGGQSDGFAFMMALVGYLNHRKAGGNIPLEQFEAQYSELLEALAAAAPSPAEGSADAGTSDLFPNERRWHFRVVFLHPSEQMRHNLLQALQQYDCTILQGQGEHEIAGYVSYFPRQRDGLAVLARIRRLLNRWQREGRITWTVRKQKPTRRQSARKQQKKVKVKGT